MLKKAFLTTLCIWVFSSSYGQDNILKASALIGNVGVQYERALNDHFSLVGQLGFARLANSSSSVETVSTGFGYYLEGRYYFSSNDARMEGWHLGVFYNAINTESSDNFETNIASVGLATGYQWIFDSNITFGLVIGAGTYNLDSEQDRGLFIDGLTFWPHIGLNLGYSF